MTCVRQASIQGQVDVLMQKRRNAIANSLESRLLCIKLAMWWFVDIYQLVPI